MSRQYFEIARKTDDRWERKFLKWRPRLDKKSKGHRPTRWTTLKRQREAAGLRGHRTGQSGEH